MAIIRFRPPPNKKPRSSSPPPSGRPSPIPSKKSPIDFLKLEKKLQRLVLERPNALRILEKWIDWLLKHESA